MTTSIKIHQAAPSHTHSNDSAELKYTVCPFTKPRHAHINTLTRHVSTHAAMTMQEDLENTVGYSLTCAITQYTCNNDKAELKGTEFTKPHRNTYSND